MIDVRSKFETATVAVDSGARRIAGPLSVGTRFPVGPAEAPSKGRRRVAAKGAAARNRGQRAITGKSQQGGPVATPIQVADAMEASG